jgi:ribosomal protein L32
MNTGVSKKRIIKFIKWGKINIEAMNALYPCEFCGEPISTGRVCSNCKKKLHHELKIISSSKERTKNTIKNSFLQVKKSKEGPTSSTRGSLASEFIMGLREKRGGYF